VLKCRKEVTNPLAQVNLIDDDFGIAFELTLFAIIIKKEVCDVLKLFLSFFLEIWKKKSHNMLYLMLDQRLNLCLMSSFIGCKQGVSIVEEYDRWSLYRIAFEMLYLFTINDRIKSCMCKSNKRCRIWFGYI